MTFLEGSIIGTQYTVVAVLAQLLPTCDSVLHPWLPYLSVAAAVAAHLPVVTQSCMAALSQSWLNGCPPVAHGYGCPVYI